MGDSSTALAAPPNALPEAVARRGIDEFQWRTLTNSLFPGANPASVVMVVDYCRARNLDPLKKPCHIVPMQVRKHDGGTEWRDVVMPGIYEYRTTAHRTGQYLGHSEPKYGPLMDMFGVTVAEWCAITVYRWNPLAQQRIEFPVELLFAEVVALKDGKANQRWARAPRQMLTKCVEAAALREAFPEELGGETTVEEMEGRVIDISSATEIVESKEEPKQPRRKSENGNGTSQPTPPAKELPADATVVVGVIGKLYADKKPYAVLLQGNERKFTTFSDTLLADLKQFAGTTHKVKLAYQETKKDDRTFYNAVGVSIADAEPKKQASDDEPIATAGEIFDKKDREPGSDDE